MPDAKFIKRMLSEQNLINQDCNDNAHGYSELQARRTMCPIMRRDNVVRKINQVVNKSSMQEYSGENVIHTDELNIEKWAGLAKLRMRNRHESQ